MSILKFCYKAYLLRPVLSVKAVSRSLEECGRPVSHVIDESFSIVTVEIIGSICVTTFPNPSHKKNRAQDGKTVEELTLGRRS